VGGDHRYLGEVVEKRHEKDEGQRSAGGQQCEAFGHVVIPSLSSSEFGGGRAELTPRGRPPGAAPLSGRARATTNPGDDQPGRRPTQAMTNPGRNQLGPAETRANMRRACRAVDINSIQTCSFPSITKSAGRRFFDFSRALTGVASSERPRAEA